jgi:hypothetical protein
MCVANGCDEIYCYLARIIRGKTAIEVQPFRNEGKAVVP